MDNPQDIHTINFTELTTWLRRKMYVVIGSLGVFLMLLALFLNYVKSTPQDTSLENGTVFTQPQQNLKAKIDLEGAVERPGVYEMTNDSRIQDVLITAGGLTAKASRTYVSQNINLAQRVYDGQKIFIPEENLDNKQSNLSNQSNLVSLNTATEAQLDSLPGIGQVTAQKIISNRPYQSISQLIENKIVSQSVYLKIKDLISL